MNHIPTKFHIRLYVKIIHKKNKLAKQKWDWDNSKVGNENRVGNICLID